jgi:hypothetical protein
MLDSGKFLDQLHIILFVASVRRKSEKILQQHRGFRVFISVRKICLFLFESATLRLSRAGSQSSFTPQGLS